MASSGTTFSRDPEKNFIGECWRFSSGFADQPFSGGDG
jgi:hypothetical protein